jgi:hypothetical protein
MASLRKVKYSAYNVDLGMCEVYCFLVACMNIHENYQYGSCIKVMSIVERSLNIFVDGRRNSLKILAPHA